MTPIHELLNRIRWDNGFDQGLFEIVDDSDQVRRAPVHRVCEVVKDGQIIWRRPS